MDPPGAGWTYSWSKVPGSGSGNGAFNPSASVESPDFKGTSRGTLTVKVVVSDAGETCEDAEDLAVIEIDELSEDVPDQYMNSIFLEDTNNQHTVPYGSPGNELRSVRIAPTDDPSDPYVWDVDFEAKVNHLTGDVNLIFHKDGVYLIKTIRTANGGETEDIFPVWYNAGDGTTKDGDCKDGKWDRITKPTADFILVSSSTNDEKGYLVRARNAYDNFQSIGSVADVITKMENYFTSAENDSQPFSVLIVDHGTTAQMNMGAGDTVVIGGGKYIDDTNATQADRDKFKEALRDCKITTCTFAACNVATGQQGRDFIQDLANDGNCTVVAPNKKINCQSNKKCASVRGGQWIAKTDQTP